MRRLAAVVVALLFVAPLSAQERRAMTTDDALNMVQVGGALISPDGSWVLFSKSELDWDENEEEDHVVAGPVRRERGTVPLHRRGGGRLVPLLARRCMAVVHSYRGREEPDLPHAHERR